MIPEFNSRISPEAKQILDEMSRNFRVSGSPADLQIANKILEYSNLISSTEFINFCINEFVSFSRHISEIYPDIAINITFRFKSFKSFMQKLLKNSKEGKSLDIKDCLAFRITLNSNSSINSINRCYKIANILANHLLHDGFILCESRAVKTNQYKGNDILIPSQSLIEFAYANCFKDYIANPKANSYQSLHLRVRDLKFGRYLEVQIRTDKMNNRAEDGIANHEEYKHAKYQTLFTEFDSSKYPSELSEAISIEIH